VNCQYAILDDEALLHIVGPDTLTFLQGQTTCDTRVVDTGHALPGAFCTPKGRVVCDFLLCQIAENHFVLRMRRDILDSSAAAFGKYIVFSKAELQPDKQNWQVFGCWGEKVTTVLHTVFGVGSDTGKRYDSICGDGFVIIQTDDTGCQFECYIDTESRSELADKLTSAMNAGDVNSWQARQIEQGIGRIEAATVEEFIPQMLNYDLTGHVSFDKGCYTGQEVVARMHYRGKPKRRLYRATMTENQVPQAGALLYSSGSEQSVGTLVNSALDAEGMPIALVVAPVVEAESSLQLGNPNGPRLIYNKG